jgi:hypothetical protein
MLVNMVNIYVFLAFVARRNKMNVGQDSDGIDITLKSA